MLQLLLLLLGRVTLVRGVAAYIVIKLSSGRSVGQSVCLSSHGPLYYQYRGPWSSALWKNGGLDPDAVWHRRSDGSRDEADSEDWGSVQGKGYFWGEFGAHHCNQWGLYGVRMRQRRDAALFPNYFGQTCLI